MEQSLFAIIYEDEAMARRALQILKKLHQLGHVNLQKAVVAVRHPDGQIETEALRDFNIIKPKYGLAGLAGTVAGLVGAAPLGPGALVMGAFMGAAGTTAAVGYDFTQKKGLPPALLQRIEAKIPASGSAVIVQAAILNSEITSQALGRLKGGALLQLSLNQELYEQLSAALSAEQPKNPEVTGSKPVVISREAVTDEPKRVAVNFKSKT